MSRPTALVAALALIAAVAGSASASATEPSAPDQGPVAAATSGPSSLSNTQLAQLKAHSVLEKATFAKGIEYQHVEVNDDDSITVVVTADSAARAKSSSRALAPSITADLQAASIDLGVKVEVRQISDKRLDAAADQVFDTLDKWAGDLAHLVNRVGPDYDQSAVIIGSAADSAELRARAAAARFGVPVRFKVGDSPTVTGRFDDTTPWTAGNALTAVAANAGRSASCTQGYSWRRWSDNVAYASTAGHCYGINTSVYNGNPNQRIGYVAGRWYANEGPTDFELIRPTVGSVDATVWVGPKVTNDHRVVKGADNANSNANISKVVCFSGANGGMNCGNIMSINQRIEFTNPDTNLKYWTRNLTCVRFASSASGFTGGDSGGPVLSTYSDGSAYAWGQTVGGWFFEDGTLDWDNECAGIFTPVVVISAAVGASLITSP